MTLDQEVVQKFQQHDYDCGHTCFDMLGYDGHGMFPQRELELPEIARVPGVSRFELITPDYCKQPIMWAIRATNKRGEHRDHLVVRHQDKIFCPSYGTFDFRNYISEFDVEVVERFSVPFNPAQS
ncbi:hypothetical protein JXB11_03435 [Candidatus Woesearchaeota archaeon]|nr:hypothetical protein [Candidatus Woesearchaeota archaeon]